MLHMRAHTRKAHERVRCVACSLSGALTLTLTLNPNPKPYPQTCVCLSGPQSRKEEDTCIAYEEEDTCMSYEEH